MGLVRLLGLIKRRPTQDNIYSTLSLTEWREGREVADELKTKGFDISYGHLYVSFRRLEEDGWIEHIDGRDEDGPLRRYRKLKGGKPVDRQSSSYEFGQSSAPSMA